MAESQGSKGGPEWLADEQAQAWMEAHLANLKQSASGQHFLYWSLGIGFVVGLAAHVGGYLLLLSAPGGLIGLLADLLHALGWSLWTGVVVTVFVQVIPEVKRRQIRRAVDDYELLRHGKARAVGDREGAILERPHARRAGRKQGMKRHRDRARGG